MAIVKNSAERELKYNVPNRSLGHVKQILAGLCKEDDSYQTTFVHSLYFDTSDFDFAMEKAASDYLKRKIRVRFYSSSGNPFDSSESTCYFEIKNKVGSVRDKHRVALDDTFLGFFQKQGLRGIEALADAKLNELGYHVPVKVRPVFFISYRRSRFKDLFSGARIAVDSDIVARSIPQNSLGLVHSEYSLNKSVLEVKGTGKVLPYNLRLLAALDIQKFAFSKFFI